MQRRLPRSAAHRFDPLAELTAIRRLDVADTVALRRFKCHQQNQWTKHVQRTIRRDIVDLVNGALIDETAATAFGGFMYGELVAVAAWVSDEYFSVLCLATSSEYQGRGYGRQLKEYVLQTAAELGFDQVFSLVHRANFAMLAINIKLGAWIEPDNLDSDFSVCVIDV